jgi:hypothetical protein
MDFLKYHFPRKFQKKSDRSRATCAKNCTGPAIQNFEPEGVFDCTPGAIMSGRWTGYSGQFRYTRHQCWGGPASTHVGRTVHRCGRRSWRGMGGRMGYSNDGTEVGSLDRLSYRLHSSGFSRGLETSGGGFGGGPQALLSYKLHSGGSCGGQEQVDIEGARCRSHGPAAKRRRARVYWTGTTCRAAPLACSDWSEERDVRQSRLDRVEGGGDNGKPGRRGAGQDVLLQPNVPLGRWIYYRYNSWGYIIASVHALYI